MLLKLYIKKRRRDYFILLQIILQIIWSPDLTSPWLLPRLISSFRWFYTPHTLNLTLILRYPYLPRPIICPYDMAHIKTLPKREKSFIFWNSEFWFRKSSFYTALLHAQYWPILQCPDTKWACSQKINFPLTQLNYPIDTIEERPLVPHCQLPSHKLYYEISMIDKVYSNRNFWNRTCFDILRILLWLDNLTRGPRLEASFVEKDFFQPKLIMLLWTISETT